MNGWNLIHATVLKDELCGRETVSNIGSSVGFEVRSRVFNRRYMDLFSELTGGIFASSLFQESHRIGQIKKSFPYT